MTVVALGIFTVLAVIAALHVAWGLGMIWPRRSEAELVATVVGYRKDHMPPPVQCFIAALAIFIPGVIALMLTGIVRVPAPPWLVALAGIMAAAVFTGRGIAGYLQIFRRRFPREPFASFDRRYYSPLCILLAAGLTFVLLVGTKG